MSLLLLRIFLQTWGKCCRILKDVIKAKSKIQSNYTQLALRHTVNRNICFVKINLSKSHFSIKSPKLHKTICASRCVSVFAPISWEAIEPHLTWLVQMCSNGSYTAASAINLLMFVSSELFSLHPSKEWGQHLDATQNPLPACDGTSTAKCLGALCCSLLFCLPLFPSDWLSWHFLTVSVNHLTVTAYYYGVGRAWAATWCNSPSLMLHHVIYIEMAKLLRSGGVNGCYNSKRTRWTHAGGEGEYSPWPLLGLEEMCSISTLLVFCHQVAHVLLPFCLLILFALRPRGEQNLYDTGRGHRHNRKRQWQLIFASIVYFYVSVEKNWRLPNANFESG